MTLSIDLHHITQAADRATLERIPRAVATYYLAIPLASEDDRVTVVTAYPENVAALSVLERLLDAVVVPISSSEEALQKAIAEVYPDSPPASETILVWTDEPIWGEAVIRTARMMAEALDHNICLPDPGTTLDDVLRMAESGEFSLVVSHVADERNAGRLIRGLATSLLLVRGEFVAVENLLVVLRGYGSDFKTLERVVPLIRYTMARTTVLPLTNSAMGRPDEFLQRGVTARHHLDAFTNQLDYDDAGLAVRLSQGEPINQVLREVAEGPYDMLVIAAEADGDFVRQVISRIDNEGDWSGHPILIVKPPLSPSSLES